MRPPLGMLVAASLLVAVTARAETTVEIRTRPETPVSEIRVGYVNGTISLDRARLELQVAPHAIVGTLTLAYSSAGPSRNLEVPLAFPHGTAVRRLVAITGTQEPRALGAAPRAALVSQRLVGKPVAAVTARERYDNLLNGDLDPALLAWRDGDELSDRFALEVFPIGQGSPGIVEIGFEIPRTSQLVFDPDGQLVDRVELVVDGRRSTQAWVSSALPISLGRVSPTRGQLAPSVVSPARSLLATPTGVDGPRVPVLTFSGAPRTCATSGIDKLVIRKTVKRAHGRLLHCFMKTAQANPALAGTAHLHFTIEDGRTREISIDGDLDHPEVVSCMRREVATWEFPRAAPTVASMPERIRVNYPLRLVAR